MQHTSLRILVSLWPQLILGPARRLEQSMRELVVERLERHSMLQARDAAALRDNRRRRGVSVSSRIAARSLLRPN